MPQSSREVPARTDRPARRPARPVMARLEPRHPAVTEEQPAAAEAVESVICSASRSVIPAVMATDTEGTSRCRGGSGTPAASATTRDTVSASTAAVVAAVSAVAVAVSAAVAEVGAVVVMAVVEAAAEVTRQSLDHLVSPSLSDRKHFPTTLSASYSELDHTRPRQRDAGIAGLTWL